VWLLLFDRVFGGRVDTFFTISRRVVSLVALVVFVFGFALTLPSARVNAQSNPGQNSSTAMAYCQANFIYGIYTVCQFTTSGSGAPQVCSRQGASGSWGQCINFVGPVLTDPCSNITLPPNGDYSGPMIQNSYTMTINGTDPSSGASVPCIVNVTVEGTPVQDAYGHWHNMLTFANADAPASVGTGTANGTFLGVTGSALTTQPTAPTSSAPPVLCGGGSCYDAATNTYTAVTSSGSQITIPAGTADSSGGGCASSGSATMCGGSPTPPSPVGTSGSTITSPATQIQSSDGYTYGNPSTGAVGSATITVYSSGGGTTSGAPSGSVSATKGSSSTSSGNSTSPASSSSSGNGDSFNGGGNCNTPPACTGDAVMCGVAQEAWQTSCNVSIQTTALAGSSPTQQPPTFASDQTKYSLADVTQQASSGNTTGDQANQGTYDQSGFGYATACPLTDLTVDFTVGSFVIPFSKACIIGPWIYWTVIGFSLFAAARITAGSAF
jgi:hypothetical protein